MNGWIRKADRLPEDGQFVLSCEGCAGKNPRMQVLQREGDSWMNRQDGLNYSIYVDFWMPLPEPPQDSAPSEQQSETQEN
ncbi:MAG: DUF551 domain-containing protein [Pseudomonadota bacterium]